MSRRVSCFCRLLRFPLLGIAFALLFSQPTRAESDSAKYHFYPCATEDSLWVAIGEWGSPDKGYRNWLACLDRRSTDIRSVGGPLEQSTQVVRAAATGDDVHIFYADGTHFRYTARSSRRELRLPDAVLPEAVSSDADGSTSDIWAVVRAPTALAVATEWQNLQRSRGAASQPQRSSNSAPASQAVMRGVLDKAFHVVHYTGSDWQPEFAAPIIPVESKRIWFTIHEGQFHFFWQRSQLEETISYARYDKGKWTPGPSISLDRAPQEVSVGIGNLYVVLVALIPQHGDGLLGPVLFKRTLQSTETDDSNWIQSAPLTTMDSKPLALRSDSAAAVFGDQIAIVRSGSDGAELGFYGLGGEAPDQNFRPVPLQRTLPLQDDRGTRDLRTGLALALLLMVVLWQRHTTFTVPVSLPPGLVLAGFARRMLAAILDFLPAALIVGIIWSDGFRKAVAGLTPSSESAEVEAAARLLIMPFMVMISVYIVYCMGFELVWSRTPGKWLMGCAVISESMTRANWLQIVVRNATRLIELQPFLPIFPLLLLVAFTRNRQRVGDLLARTLVVQRGVNEGEVSSPPSQE